MIMFIPGETIAHQFYIPYTRGDVKQISVSYRQDGQVFLVKNVYPPQITDESSGTGSSFVVTLSQQESLLFKDDFSFKVQLNVIFVSDARAACPEMDGRNGMQHIREVVN